jgi:Domain of unknown function (DUF4055)
MAVDTKHESWDMAHDAWKLVRDTAFGGGRQVKREGLRYLPMLRGQSPIDYDAYRTRANFFNITKRTLSAWVGFIFTNNPEVDPGPSPSSRIAELLRDCTMTGKTFYGYVKETVRDVVSVGRRGTLVEWANPAVDDRPFLIAYDTEDIINWRYKMVNGRRMLALVVLCEKSDEANDRDSFQSETVTRWRVLQLIEEGGQPYAYSAVWEKDAKGEIVKAPGLDGYPQRGTTPLGFLPFVFHNVSGDEAEPGEIPLEDLADTNVSHYQNSANLEQAVTLCGNPTLVLIGFEKKGEYFLGSSQALVTEELGASAQFLQIDAQSVSAIVGQMDSKEKQMAALGARMLEQQGRGRGQEAFETVQIRHSGEVSALTDIAIQCSDTLSKVLRLAVWWDDRTVELPEDLADEEGENVHVELNTEFTTTKLDSGMLTSLTAAYQTGAISYEAYFENLQKGGIISSEKSIEDERKAIEDSPVALPGGDGMGVRAPGEPPTNLPPQPPSGGPGDGATGSKGAAGGQ